MHSGSPRLAVRKKCFNQLIAAYFAAPTDHIQKLQFTETTIKCCDVSYERIPELEQRYLPFKTIELVFCQFVSEYETSLPQAISHWLGRSISELDSDSVKYVDSCYFKVEDKTVGQSRKRKHGELEAKDSNSNE